MFKRLNRKKYIKKEEVFINGIKFCKYKNTVSLSSLPENKVPLSENKVLQAVEQSSHNSIDNNIVNNIDNNIDNRILNNINEFIENYHKHANKFSKIHKLTDKRKNK